MDNKKISRLMSAIRMLLVELEETNNEFINSVSIKDLLKELDALNK